MCYDAEHQINWFHPTKLKKQWKSACDSLGGLPGKRPRPDEKKRGKVMEEHTKLCAVLMKESPSATKLLNGTYCTYMERYPDPKPIGKRAKPFVLFVGGPPGSGKSMENISPEDFKMIQEKTARTVSGVPKGVPKGALLGRNHKDFKKEHVAQINIDRLVESVSISKLVGDLSTALEAIGDPSKGAKPGDPFSTPMSQLSKTLQAWSEVANPGEKDFITKQPYYDIVNKDLGNLKKNTTDKHLVNDVVEKDIVSLKQHTYWMMRKALMLDDLNNAHQSRLLAGGHDLLYETVFGDRFLSWAEKFEFEKMRAAGHELVVVLMQVKLEELLKRMKDREKETGQASAPKDQVEAAIKEGQKNFVKVASKLDYGVAMSHVQSKKFKGTGLEEMLAAFSGIGQHPCYTHCANATVMKQWDVSSTFGVACEGKCK